jgi:hypothetical protein
VLSILKFIWFIYDTNDGRRTTAILANRKNSKSLFITPQNILFKPLKMVSLKNHDPRFAKNGDSGLIM